MREIDPIRNPSEALLSAALNRLAKGSPRQAPPNLGAELAQEFRRHHVRRRRRMAAVISIVASLVLATTVFLTWRLSLDNAPRFVQQPVPTVAPNPNPPAPDTAAKSTPVQERKPERRAAQSVASSAEQSEFVPVGVFDPSMAAGDLKVVRLELTGADLRLVGAPVAEDLSDRRLLADIVVTSDGTPYAVRLVR